MNIHRAVVLIGFSLFALNQQVDAAAMNDTGLACIIEPSCTVNLGSEVFGIIEEITVDRGDTVQKGQVLVRLDAKVERATMESRKARYEYAQNEFQRKSGLYAKAMISTHDYDEAETNLKINQRDFEEAEKSYERRIIRSPIDGVVVERNMQPGERVDEKPIMKLVQISPLYVEVIAPSSMLGSVKTGDRVVVRPENPIKKEYIGRVKIVDNVVHAASGTFGIRIELENKNYELPSGLKCSVRFSGREKASKEPSRASGTSAQTSAKSQQDRPATLPARQPVQ